MRQIFRTTRSLFWLVLLLLAFRSQAETDLIDAYFNGGVHDWYAPGTWVHGDLGPNRGPNGDIFIAYLEIGGETVLNDQNTNLHSFFIELGQISIINRGRMSSGVGNIIAQKNFSATLYIEGGSYWTSSSPLYVGAVQVGPAPDGTNPVFEPSYGDSQLQLDADGTAELTGDDRSVYVGNEGKVVIGLDRGYGFLDAERVYGGLEGAELVFNIGAGADYSFAPAAEHLLKLVKQGDGKVTLTNTGNNYSGGTVIEGGTLVQSVPGSIPTGSTDYSSNFQIDSGATLELHHDLLMTGLTGGGSIELKSTGDLHPKLILQLNESTGFSGDITGTGSFGLGEYNAGEVHLTWGQSVIEGDLFVRDNELKISDGASVTSTSGTIHPILYGESSVVVQNGGNWTVNGGGINGGEISVGSSVSTDAILRIEAGGTVTIGEDSTGKGTGTVRLGGGSLQFGGADLASGILNAGMVVGDAAGSKVEFNQNNDFHFTHDGTATGKPPVLSGHLSVVQAGSGTTRLYGENLQGYNSYGVTLVEHGTLVAAYGALPYKGEVEVTGGNLILNGREAENELHILGRLEGSGGRITANTALELAQESHTTYGGVIEGTGFFSLIDTGTTNGSITLTGDNTFSGGTAINAGTLILGSSTAAGTGAISVWGGTLDIGGQSISNSIGFVEGTIGGTGTINGSLAVTSAQNILSPGNSPGTLEFSSSQSWESYTYLWEVNDWAGTTAGTDFDQIRITGGLSLSETGSYFLDINSLTAGNVVGDVPNFSESDQSWIIISTTTGITGFDEARWTLQTGDFSSSPDWGGSFSLDEDGNNLVLNYAAVPEPSTFALVLVTLAATLLLRRRRSVQR